MASGDTLQPQFGRALRRLRRQAGLTQEGLAERSGNHWTYISELERGLKSPSLATIAALARGLDVQPHELVAAAEQQPD